MEIIIESKTEDFGLSLIVGKKRVQIYSGGSFQSVLVNHASHRPAVGSGKISFNGLAGLLNQYKSAEVKAAIQYAISEGY